MRMTRTLWTLYVATSILLCVPISTVLADTLVLNEDGHKLIQEARQAYDSDMLDRPLITDAASRNYVLKVAKNLLSQGNPLGKGVQLSVTVVDSPKPEIYSYIDGHLVVSSGLVYGMDNEAQLAGVLASQVAHLSEGYYLTLYQQIKAKERKQQFTAAAGAIFGVLLDSAVNYAVGYQGIEMAEDVMSGNATYDETMKRLAAINIAQDSYYSIKDVVQNMPTEDAKGRPIDPRLQFEPLADAQGMIFCARAGYLPSECALGWDNIQRINHRLLKEEEKMMGAYAEQMRAQRRISEMNRLRMQQYMGDLGLVQTPSHAQASRAQFVTGLTNMKEVRAASGRATKKGEHAYRKFIEDAILPRAQTALDEERYKDAHKNFQILYNLGVRSASVAYGMAKSTLGDFAFGASPGDLKAAEKFYREAARLDPKFAEPYRGLAELYGDSDEYEKAIEAWQAYLKLAPEARDRKKIERKIKTLKRKAQR